MPIIAPIKYKNKINGLNERSASLNFIGTN